MFRIRSCTFVNLCTFYVQIFCNVRYSCAFLPITRSDNSLSSERERERETRISIARLEVEFSPAKRKTTAKKDASLFQLPFYSVRPGVYLQVFEAVRGAQRLQKTAERTFPRWLSYRRVNVRLLCRFFPGSKPNSHLWSPAHLSTKSSVQFIVVPLPDATTCIQIGFLELDSVVSLRGIVSEKGKN